MSTPRPTPASPTRQQLDELEALLQRMLDLPVNRMEEVGSEDSPPASADESAVAPPEQSVEAVPPPEPVEPADLSRSRDTYPACYMVIETAAPPFWSAEDAQESASPGPEDGSDVEGPPVAAEEQGEEQHDVSDSLGEESEPSEDEEWVPLRSSWRPSPHTWQPLAESWQQAQGPGLSPSGGRESIASALGELPIPAEVHGPGAAPREEEAAPVAALPPEEPQPDVELAPLSWWLLPVVWFNRGFDACLAPLGAPGRWLQGGAGRTLLGVLGLLLLAAAAGLLVAEGIGWTW